LLKMLAVACLFFAVPALESQTGQAARGNRNLPPFPRSAEAARRPVTIWERMRDPKSWWQSREVRPNLLLQPRASVSGATSLAGSGIVNPIFFVPPVFDTGGARGRNIETGDFNGDGKTDLLVSNECVSDADCSQGTVAVLPGNGDGTYQAAVVSSTGAVLSSMAVGDFNRDGKLDVVVDNGCSDVACTNGSVNVLLGNGNGTFQAPVSWSTGGAFSIEAGDVNGDGKLDLVVVSSPTTAGLLLGNGDGTFQPVSSLITGASGNSAVFLGDFNGDHKLDLAIVTADCGTDQCDTSVSVRLGNGDGTFQAAIGNQTFTGLNVQAVALADTNGDGKLDLAVVEQCLPGTDTCVGEFLNVLLGKGDGTFQQAKSSVLGSNDVTFVGFGDLDSDGKMDLVAVDPDAGSAAVSIGAGDGNFRLAATYETEGRSPLFGVLADLNGDGKTDFATANACQADFQQPCSGAVVALLENGQGGLSGSVGYSPGGNFPVLATADLNHDGTPDMVVAKVCQTQVGCPPSSLTVLLGNPNGTFRPPVSYDPGGFSPMAVTGGDFNGDGKQDVVVVNRCVSSVDCSHGVIAVLLGNGDGTLQPVVTFTSGGSSPESVAAGDFNGDGNLDLAVAQCSESSHCLDGSIGSVSVLLGNGNGSFQAAVSYPSGDALAQAIVAADFNGDGKLDLAVANGNCTQGDIDVTCTAGSVGVLLGKGDGSFQAAVLYSSVDDNAFSLAVGDFNGDGKSDLAVGNANCAILRADFCLTGSVAALLGKGDGTFQAAVTYPAGDPWPDAANEPANGLAIADLDGDGKPDLVIANRDVLRGNGDGTFEAAQSYNPLGNLGTSVVVADFNGDSKPDLAVGEAQTGLVMVLLNIAGEFGHGTSTSLTSFLNPAKDHRRVTFTVQVTSTAPGTPTGTVTFSDDGHALDSEALSNGQAKFSTNSLEAGVHAITATYGGDDSFLPSTSAVLQQVIRSETRIKLTSSRNPSKHGRPVTFTAIVIAKSGGTPDGTVTFKDFSGELGTVQLSSGQAGITITLRRKGKHLIYANYSGSSIFRRSSALLVQRVR